MFYMKFMRYAVIAISFMSGINLHAMNNNQPQRSSSPTNLTDLFLALALNESRPNETGNNNRNNNTIATNNNIATNNTTNNNRNNNTMAGHRHCANDDDDSDDDDDNDNYYGSKNNKRLKRQ